MLLPGGDLDIDCFLCAEVRGYSSYENGHNNYGRFSQNSEGA